MPAGLALDLSALPGPADDAAALRALDAIRARRDREVAFVDLCDDRRPARACMDFARALDPRIDTVVVLGVGGSCLPARALHGALAPAFDALAPRSPGMPRRVLFVDSIDPATLRDLLERIDLDRTLWNVISKSGNTVETCAQLCVVADRLGGRVPSHVVCTTDPSAGAVRAFAAARGCTSFAIPPGIGGRFTALTPVGLLPAALAGLDVAGILDGAGRLRGRADHPATQLAAHLHHQHVVHGRSIVVLTTYVDALYDACELWRQLVAEALGKPGAGPTPIAGRGIPEQHSQLQLYADGPDDKVYVMLTAPRTGELRIPAIEGAGALGYLAGRGLGELCEIERDATTQALIARGRPVGTIALPSVSAEAVGELVMLLQLSSVIAGPLYGVEPFGEPGVEDGKRRAAAALGAPHA